MTTTAERTLDEKDRAYLAGLIDSAGHVRLRDKKGNAQYGAIELYFESLPAATEGWLKQKFPGLKVSVEHPQSGKKLVAENSQNRGIRRRLYFRTIEAAAVFVEAMTYLHVKKAEARIVWKFAKSIPSPGCGQTEEQRALREQAERELASLRSA